MFQSFVCSKRSFRHRLKETVRLITDIFLAFAKWSMLLHLTNKSGRFFQLLHSEVYVVLTYMFNDVKLEAAFVVAFVTAVIAQFQMNSIYVLLKIVLVCNQKSTFGTDFLRVFIVRLDMILQLSCREENFIATVYGTVDARNLIRMIERDVILQSSSSFH